jgi:nicotinamide-nucleotide amidase
MASVVHSAIPALEPDRISPDVERQVVGVAFALGQTLRARGWMIACAESCTGGLICRALTEIGGSSEWFERGFITYSNAAKIDMLGVRELTLQTSGAVSEPVALEMADGALRRSRAQLALSVWGFAGPGGGSPGKPVGTVCFGWASADGASHTETLRFDGDRYSVRALAALHALRQAQEWLGSVVPAPGVRPKD